MKLILYQAPFAITEIDFGLGPFRCHGHCRFVHGHCRFVLTARSSMIRTWQHAYDSNITSYIAAYIAIVNTHSALFRTIQPRNSRAPKSCSAHPHTSARRAPHTAHTPRPRRQRPTRHPCRARGRLRRGRGRSARPPRAPAGAHTFRYPPARNVHEGRRRPPPGHPAR